MSESGQQSFGKGDTMESVREDLWRDRRERRHSDVTKSQSDNNRRTEVVRFSASRNREIELGSAQTLADLVDGGGVQDLVVAFEEALQGGFVDLHLLPPNADRAV